MNPNKPWNRDMTRASDDYIVANRKLMEATESTQRQWKLYEAAVYHKATSDGQTRFALLMAAVADEKVARKRADDAWDKITEVF